MTEELKPCPFCGGKGQVVHRILPSRMDVWYGCSCRDCGAHFDCFRYSEELAIEQWNTRVIE